MSDRHATKDIFIDGKRLQIKKFRMSIIKRVAPCPTMTMVASRGSGKSTAIRALMAYFADVPGGNIISKTERFSRFFGEFFAELFIFDKYNSDIVANLLERQTMIKLKNEKRLKDNHKRIKQGKKPKRAIDTRAWLIMDDCLAQGNDWKRDEPMLEVFMNGRHYCLFYMLTLQYPLGIGPELRSNIDFIFIFGIPLDNIRRKVHQYYTGMFRKYDMFERVLKKCTVNFGCMVIDNRTKSERIEDIVYWWKAPNKEIKELIGHRSFIKHHNKYYDRRSKYRMPKFNRSSKGGRSSGGGDADIELMN